ncbi:unnamed protein product [Durusdinium trenchii]|uniref:Calpain-1 catalytic subunit (Calcium-activated neutral proteinase 1) (CANP 1) (Calpain mu-type) (Calpain-1 large subunit) (Micromolar-calpain) (MuCANP) n=2 Tax=Durusdinium trenchii TaxID=1381693 RepID=A0ABP0LUH8_9DINO
MAYSLAVIDVFKRFDTDGSGSINRDELRGVLRALGGGTWDNKAVDELLAKADNSGDEQLGIAEFVGWVFAEDGQRTKIGEHKKGDFKLTISNSSHKGLNGVYVVQDRISGRRPTFYCSKQKRTLYYAVSNKAWKIYYTPGKSKNTAAYLKTTRAPHMTQDGEYWVSYVNGKYRRDDGMSCTVAAEESPEEQIAHAAESVSVVSPSVVCELTKQSQLQDGRPVYADDDSHVCVYNEKQQKWQFGLKDAAPEGFSKETAVFSPDHCLWDGLMEVEDARIERAGDPDSPGWVDPDFPHTAENIGETFVRQYGHKIVWRRLADVYPNRPLYDEEAPYDLSQGSIGNCALISCIAAVGEFGSYLQSLFKTKDPADGKYEIWLYMTEKRAWEIFQIDDYVPCIGNTPIFLKAKHSLWAPLLEKAFAKLCGSYWNLNASSNSHWGGAVRYMTTLTGGQLHGHFRRHDGQTVISTKRTMPVTAECDPTSESRGTVEWGKCLYELERQGKRLKFKYQGTKPADAQEGWISTSRDGKEMINMITAAGWTYTLYELGDDERWYHSASVKKKIVEEVEGVEKPEEFMWQKFQEFAEKKYLITVGIGYGEKGRTGLRPDGLCYMHSYSVLHAKQVGDFKMICCRNPWGHGEWSGAWSDESEEWEANPEVAEALKLEAEDDGIFWMEFKDFISIFKEICITGMETPPS